MASDPRALRGSTSAASAQDMCADAYATGDHVVLGRGADLHTVAHEAIRDKLESIADKGVDLSYAPMTKNAMRPTAAGAQSIALGL